MFKDSPADQAGLKVHDIIVKLNDESLKVSNQAQLQWFKKHIEKFQPGDTIKLTVVRNGEEREIEVELGKRPKSVDEAERFNAEAFGLKVRELLPGDILRLDIPQETTGVIVETIESGSAAQIAEVEPDDIIQRLNDEECETIEDFRAIYGQLSEDKPDDVVMFVLRGSGTAFVHLEPHWEAIAEEEGAEESDTPEESQESHESSDS